MPPTYGNYPEYTTENSPESSSISTRYGYYPEYVPPPEHTPPSYNPAHDNNRLLARLYPPPDPMLTPFHPWTVPTTATEKNPLAPLTRPAYYGDFPRVARGERLPVSRPSSTNEQKQNAQKQEQKKSPVNAFEKWTKTAHTSTPEDPNKPHAYTNKDYAKWAKQHGVSDPAPANGPESGLNKAAEAQAEAAKMKENSATSTTALYQYLTLVDTLSKINANPKLAASMDPSVKATLETMVNAQGQQMLAQAIGAGNAARLADLQKQGVGWTGSAAPGAAAAYMRQMYLPQMAAQHQQAMSYAMQHPSGLPNGMSPEAYTNLSQDAYNALGAAPAGTKAPAQQARPVPIPFDSTQRMSAAPPAQDQSMTMTSPDPNFMAQAQGFSPFDSTYIPSYSV